MHRLVFIFGIVSIPSTDAMTPVFAFGPSSTVEINDSTANVPGSPARILGIGGTQLNVNDTNTIRFFTDPTYGVV